MVPSASAFVPSLAASTPVPAVAAVMPEGNWTGGHTFRHLAVHAVLLGFSV